MTDIENSNSSLRLTGMPIWQRLVCNRAARLRVGQLNLRFPGGREHDFVGSEPGPSASIEFKSARALRRLLTGGGLGFARAYIDGDWQTPDLGAVQSLAIANEPSWQRIIKPGRIASAFAYLRHRLRRNSKSGSRRNIAFHYDLGNEFYANWLDETMSYSSALFSAADQSLADAQTAKYGRIIRELGIGPDDRVLEIGCGWGGFAEQAIRETGCHVTGLTLSREQASFARERLQKAGLSGSADIRLEDYRDCKGEFTKIVSIEMFEAVGEENWPTYFDRVRDLLAAGGQAMIQVITIAEERFEYYRRNADFIQTYIFPGGMLPSIPRFTAATSKSGLGVLDIFRFGHDYDRTLLAWDRTFRAKWQKIAPLGFDQRFFRMWHYYLHYCATGFRTDRLDVVQFRLERH